MLGLSRPEEFCDFEVEKGVEDGWLDVGHVWHDLIKDLVKDP